MKKEEEDEVGYKLLFRGVKLDLKKIKVQPLVSKKRVFYRGGYKSGFV